MKLKSNSASMIAPNTYTVNIEGAIKSNPSVKRTLTLIFNFKQVVTSITTIGRTGSGSIIVPNLRTPQASSAIDINMTYLPYPCVPAPSFTYTLSGTKTFGDSTPNNAIGLDFDDLANPTKLVFGDMTGVDAKIYKFYIEVESNNGVKG